MRFSSVLRLCWYGSRGFFRARICLFCCTRECVGASLCRSGKCGGHGLVGDAWGRFPGGRICAALCFTGQRQPVPRKAWYILFLTFAVILVTLLFQGLTLPIVIQKLCIKADNSTDEEERTARLKANQAAIESIEKLARQRQVFARHSGSFARR